jgi:cyclic pyranopterin phosphate synthase
MLIDTYGRVATDPRVSLTDVGEQPALHPLHARRGPAVAGQVGIIEWCAALTPRPRLSLTTNGIGLERTAEALEHVGLDRANVSLDTLRPAVFKALTRRDRHRDVLQGLLRTPVRRADAARRPARPAARRPGHRRGHPGESAHPLHAHPEPDEARGTAPAERWLVEGGPARVGVIASVTRPFCRACDRTRLTADGPVRTCLFAREDSDLRGALRSWAPDEEIAGLRKTAM